MTVVRTRTRALAAASAVALLLGLAACGGGDDDKDTKDSSSSGYRPRTRREVHRRPGHRHDDLDVRHRHASTRRPSSTSPRAAVVQINNDGGLGGHELKLITCNDSADPNKAADCARQAVDEGVAALVGGFTANGDAIMPILEEAGIPWFGPPGISSAELSSANSYPITSGVLGLAGLGQMAAEDGCDKVASVNYDLPSAGQIAQLVDLALTNAGPRAVHPDQGPADHHRLQHHRAGDQRLRLRRGRHAAAAVPRHRCRRRPARQHDQVLRGARRPHRPRGRRTAARRSRAPSRSRTSRTPTTRSGTTPRSTSATWPTRRTAAGPGCTSRTPGSPTAPSCR